MKTIQITLYDFDELSEEAQEKAIINQFDVNVDHDWWDFVYEDANTIGLHISSFDIDGRGSITAHLTRIDMVVQSILKNHGNECETYKIAMQYLKDHDYNRFEYKIKKEYLNMLRREYAYETSDEAIKETIKANEWTFTVDGILDNRE